MLRSLPHQASTHRAPAAASSTHHAQPKTPASLAPWQWLLFPLAALFVVVPLHAHGVACGDDFPFHMTNWVDAARQIRGGTLYPHWTSLGAYGAGEPRFTFYPPISWMLGALLVMLAPGAPTTVLFIFVALTTAGISMYRLLRTFAAPGTALGCAMLYAVNPYMVCNAVDRSAFAELLAATWVPLLLQGLLRQRPTLPGLAVPLALLWLTNVPSAIMGVYTFCGVFLLRLAMTFWQQRNRENARWTDFRQLLMRGLGGLGLGVSLPALYMLPVLWEKRYIRGAAAFTGDYAVDQNTLFLQNGHLSHDHIVHLTSSMAVGAFVVGVLALGSMLRRNNQVEGPGAPTSATMLPMRDVAWLLLGMTVLLLFAQTRASLLFWRLPELNLIQFPWRLLTVLFAVVVLSLGLAVSRWRHPRRMLTAGLCFSCISALLAVHVCRRGCAIPLFDQFLAQNAEDHGFLPTPEYTVLGASDAPLGINEPAYWLTGNLDGLAPGTLLNGTTENQDPNFAPGWGPRLTRSARAPHDLSLRLAQPTFLVLHQRSYPNWAVLVDGQIVHALPQRADGLIAVPLPAGTSTVALRWHTPWDQYAGAAVSALAALVLLLLRAPWGLATKQRAMQTKGISALSQRSRRASVAVG